MEKTEKEIVLSALRRAQTLAGLVTIRQIFDAGNDAINASGLNPYCMNEGLASGDETITPWFLDVAINIVERE